MEKKPLREDVGQGGSGMPGMTGGADSNPISVNFLDPKRKFVMKTYLFLTFEEGLSLLACKYFEQNDKISAFYRDNKFVSITCMFIVMFLPIWLIVHLREKVRKLFPWNYLLYMFFTAVQAVVLAGFSDNRQTLLIICGMFAIVTMIITLYAVLTDFNQSLPYRLVISIGLAVWLGTCAMVFLNGTVNVKSGVAYMLATFIWGYTLFDGKFVFKILRHTKGDDPAIMAIFLEYILILMVLMVAVLLPKVI